MLEKRVTNRVIWIDYIKGICMFCVMASHLLCCPISFRHFFLPWFLTGFFFCSGYVYKKESFKSFFIKKAKTILFPWLVFGFMEIGMLAVFGNSNMSLMKLLKCNFLQVKGYYESLWFLPALFISMLYADFLIKRFEGYALMSVSFILCLAGRVYNALMPENIFPWNSVNLPWHINNMFLFGFFIVIGYMYKQQFEERLDRDRKLLFFLIIASIIFFSMLFLTKNSEPIGVWDF